MRSEPTPVIPDDEKLEKFKRDIECDGDLSQDTRDDANRDMRFINVPGGMWEDEFEEFGNRCKLELDKCSDYVQRFIGEWNLNRVGVDFRPDDHKTSTDDAVLLNGIYRADFRRSYGKLATDNAVDEAATCGYGAMMLSHFFVDEEDPENNTRRVEWRPIYNAYDTVIWDKAAKRIDKSDARWVTVLWPFTKEEFEDNWPDKTPSSAYDPNSNNYNMRADTIYVAERYEVVKKRTTHFVYANLATGEQEVFDSDKHKEEASRLRTDPGMKFMRKRRIIKRSVEKTMFSGNDILEETQRIAGKHIPIVPFYGYRSWVDGVENYRGLVRKLKDACRLFNMLASQWAENSASNGSDKPIFTPDQMKNPEIAEIWADLTDKPYALADSVMDEAGNPVHHGPVGYIKAPQLDGSTVALATSVNEFIQSMTGGAPQETIDPNISGKALNALMKRSNMSTQVVNDNIATAIARSGTVFQSIAAEIYGEADMIFVAGLDGEESSKQLSQTVEGPNGTLEKINVLDGKKFHSYADVGPQYETLREEAAENSKGAIELLAQIPGNEDLMTALTHSFITNVDGPGLEPLKKKSRQKMILQGDIEPETDDDKEFVQRVQQQQQAQEPNPQTQLIMAAIQQAMAEARNLDAASAQKMADAGKKEAETTQIFADMQNQQTNTVLAAEKQNFDQQTQILESLRGLPVQ